MLKSRFALLFFALLFIVLCCGSWALAQTAPSGGAPPAGGSRSAGQTSTPGSPATPPSGTATPPASTATPPAGTATPPAGTTQQPAELRTQRCRVRRRRLAPPQEVLRSRQPSTQTLRITLAVRPAALHAELSRELRIRRWGLRRTPARRVRIHRHLVAQVAKAITERRLAVLG